jgi:hypothetical protein
LTKAETQRGSMMFPRQPELENALITKEVGGKEVGIEENQFDERIDEPLM